MEVSFCDKEMRSAIDELQQAQQMLDNAVNKHRIDEASYRIDAANARIEAIRLEKVSTSSRTEK